MELKKSGTIHPNINKDTIISFLKQHKDFLEREYGVTKIALFGSYARGEETKDSDIDLLIEAKEQDFDNRYDLKEFLEENFNKKVDIDYFDCIRSFIRHQIEDELVSAKA